MKHNLTTVDLGWLGNLEKRLIQWLYERFHERLLYRYGGIQKCAYCNQCAQAHDGWHFDSKTDPFWDFLNCGNCGGVTRYRFELGMIPFEPHGVTPPVADKSA